MLVSYEENQIKKAKLDFNEINKAASAASRELAAQKAAQKEVNIDLASSCYQLNMKGFIAKFKAIDSMSDSDLLNFVEITYLDALEISNIKNSRPDEEDFNELVKVFTNPRFLLAMKQIINKRPLDYAHSIYLNYLVYQYLMLRPVEQRDPIVSDLYIQMSQMTNINLITTLCSCNLDKSLVTSVAIAAGSSFDDTTRIRRVNKVILLSTGVRFELQNIVDIYQYTFGKLVTKLFITTMFQVFDRTKLSEQQNEVDGLLGLAILVILSNMPIQSIKLVLTSYANYCIGNYAIVRFSMNTLSNDYARIKKAVFELNQDGVAMP